jgi:hypothetical protein
VVTLLGRGEGFDRAMKQAHQPADVAGHAATDEEHCYGFG